MKKIVSIIICLAACIFVFSSCETKEEKAEKVIDSYFKSEMTNYNSYQPIETTVIPAKNVVRNNIDLRYSLQVYENCLKCDSPVDDNTLNYIKKHISDLDSNEIIGWEVIHRYRFLNDSDKWEIAEEHFLVGKDFNEILMKPYTIFEAVHRNKLVATIDTANVYSKKFDGFDLQLLQLGE